MDIATMMIYTRGCTVESRQACWKHLFTAEADATDTIRVELDAAQRALIDKDVFRTDRTVAFYCPDVGSMEGDLELPRLKQLGDLLRRFAMEHAHIGYVQGMNEIASPILYVMEDVDDAYRVFCHVMIQHVERSP